MKKLLITLGCITLTACSGMAIQEKVELLDPVKSVNSTVITKVVNYQCQSNKKVSVTYGFDKQNKPTYAQAFLNGKTRFMPLNIKRTDQVDTVFGDENNFSLTTSHMTVDNYQLPILITDPAQEIIFKNCKVVKTCTSVQK